MSMKNKNKLLLAHSEHFKHYRKDNQRESKINFRTPNLSHKCLSWINLSSREQSREKSFLHIWKHAQIFSIAYTLFYNHFPLCIKKDYHSHLKILSLPSVVTIWHLCKEIFHKLHESWKKKTTVAAPTLFWAKKKKKLNYHPLIHYLQENATVLQFDLWGKY